MEISSGTYHLERIKGSNCYLAIFEEGLFLIDTGMPGNAGRIIRQIREIGRKPEDVRMIFITHPDIDHAGSVAELKRITHARIAIHVNDAPALAGERESKKVKGVIGCIIRLLIKTIKFEPVRADLLLNDGDEIGPFKIIHTPGHTEGSICLYYAGNSVLFVGDALRTDKKGNPRIPPEIMNHYHGQVMESVQKLKELDFRIMLPGHGRPILEGASRKIAEI